MNNSFVNIGNKAFVRVGEIICIEAADSDKETRSIIFLKDNKYCVSSVNASVLAKRAQNDASEFIDEK